MNTEQEAREAASRVKSDGDDRFASSADYRESAMRDDDIEVVAAWVLAELSRREADQAERAKPIDAAWCLANGARQINKSGEVMWAFNAVNMFWQAEYGVSLDGDSYERIYLHEITTRGQLLDLIAALKGGAT